MRALVLLYLLHAVFGQVTKYSWYGPVQEVRAPDPALSSACLADQTSCGCCLMKKNINYMEMYFNQSIVEMKNQLMTAQTALNDMRASRSAFSVALNNQVFLTCIGPVNSDTVIIYKHVFLNLGNGYNVQTGVFTAPRSGVYSLAVTIYGNKANLASCASLQVNGIAVARLNDQIGQDPEDSNSAVAAVKLNAGDKVTMNLLKNCLICDDFNHFNTFTGFLLYATN
ncbi:uncharacterized protein LOC125013882 isoform X2 [Mugil cephalus]|uniref:uncharacterized protein LOC125013882 isoform X2 n=1 Tax=Mugil cephalus TaxID=48193 RepID=UPI001FB784C8|nr:uncharacterized protein LOC125013882 isoform X2 [Mugil cephalus]